MVFDFTVGKVCSLPLKVQSGTLNAQWVWHIWQFQHLNRKRNAVVQISKGLI